MIRYLLLIPLALLIAVGASTLFLFIASVVDPVMGTLTGDTLLVGFWAFVDEVFSVEDPGPMIAETAFAVGRVAFLLLVFPPLLVAVVGEVVRARSVIWYAGAMAVLTAAIPWVLRGSARIATPGELHVSAVLGLTGAVAGLIYWAIAGRDAGGFKPSDPPFPGRAAP
ncbi:hypothetical protein [Microvirga puerhi]|uniref:Uncharacterized protein n=1 Tax=Microvirga puerhi TaxID=2876078 RepID=A0ABS7VKX1_9HYPH|nr:hypothetical protein [Microvirga puerhi]MBZ6075657.1 hypothetical protein [Microvirga puerhi]